MEATIAITILDSRSNAIFQDFIFLIYISDSCSIESNLTYGIGSRQNYLRFHARASQLLFYVYMQKNLLFIWTSVSSQLNYLPNNLYYSLRRSPSSICSFPEHSLLILNASYDFWACLLFLNEATFDTLKFIPRDDIRPCSQVCSLEWI